MITAEDTYDVAGRVLEIPVTAIRPAPDNVRTNLGDLDELAASIAEVGVLQPIRVIPDASGDTFMVLIGHRRHAAAQLAGLMTIPSIVGARPEDEKRIVAMTIENIQRLDMSVLDEARAFARLEEEFGLTQVDIAKRVGCKQPHVSKRLSLLELPDKCKTMLDAGELNVTDALDLVKLAGYPENLAAVLESWEGEESVDERRWALDGALDDIAAIEARRALVAELTASQTPMIDDEQAKRMHRVIGTDEYVSTGKKITFTPANAKKHDAESCHAVHVLSAESGLSVRADRMQRPYCMSPDRHGPKGDSKLKSVTGDKDAGPEKSPAELAADAQRKARIDHRKAFVRELIRDKKLDRAKVTAVALTTVALDGYHDGQKRTCALLGLDLKGREPDIALRDHVKGGTDAMIRAALASMLNDADKPFLSFQTTALLEQFGYVPSDDELAEKATVDASRTLDKVLERAQELNQDDAAILRLEEELSQGVSSARAVEVRAELDAMFIALNDIQPGDVVDHDGEGHTIDRAEANGSEDTDEAHAAPANDEDHGTTSEVNGSLLAEGDAASTAELAPDDHNQFAEELNNIQDGDIASTVLCAFPGCKLDDEHDGDHDTESADYVKPAKDCSFDEAWSREQIETVLADRPDDPEAQAIQEELHAGVDETRAHEIRARLDSMLTLTDYLQPARDAMERKCRVVVADCPTDHPRVRELQQQLYRGVKSRDANSIMRELKKIKAANAK